VTVVDADVTTSNLGLSLGMFQLPLGLQDVLRGDIDIEDSIYRHPFGLKVIPSSLSFKYIQSSLSLNRFKNLIKKLGGLVIIDSPPGIGKDVTSIMKASDEIIVVTNPQITAVTDSFKAVMLAKELGIDSVSIVVNRIRGKHEMTKQEIESMCEAPVIGEIPEDPWVDRSLFEKVPIIYNKPLSPAALAYTKIAHTLAGMEYKPPRFLRVKRLLGLSPTYPGL